MNNEALSEQWEDILSIAEFVQDALVDEAKESPVEKHKQLLDGVRAVQATIRQAKKTAVVLGWQTEGEYDG